MMGCDVQPRESDQIILAAIGCFMGAIINANIFGELAMILQGLDKVDKSF